MKKSKEIIRIVIVVVLLVASFIPVFSDRMLMSYPGPDGEILTEPRTYHYSMVENIFDSGSGIFYILFALSGILTVVFTIGALAGKRTRKLSDIFFILTVILFVLCVAVALSVHRKF